MISLMMAGAVGMAALQAGIDVPRKNFVTCLKTAYDTALTQNVPAPTYGAFVIAACTTQADSLRNGLVGFDVKNGIKRTQAAADAQAQIDDYVAMSTEKYESKLAVSKPKSTPAAPTATAPPPTPAAAPKN